MNNTKQYDVVIVGGSYAGLAAAMSLGRALRNVLIIDGGKPCNRFVHHAHNFITHDGKAPAAIMQEAKQQVLAYNTVEHLADMVTHVKANGKSFDITTASGELVHAKKVLFTTGLTDVIPDVPGLRDCWGKSMFHCPYCHGYEVRGQRIAVLAKGDAGFEMSRLISNWTNDIVLITDGEMENAKHQQLMQKNVTIVKGEVATVEQRNGDASAITLVDGQVIRVDAIFARFPMKQHCDIPERLGCELTDMGQIKVDMMYRTNIPGIYAAGDNSTMMRALASAVAAGTAAGAVINHHLIEETF